MLIALSIALARPGLLHADDRRIALVGAPDSVEQAAITTLSPWQITVVMLPSDPTLNGEEPTQRALELADENRVRAVLWLGRIGKKHALWLYDAQAKRLASRPLTSQPPFTDSAAASVALSMKTLLRNNKLLPAPREPTATDETEPEAPVPTAEPEPEAIEKPLPNQRVEIMANLGLREGLSSNSSTDPRLGIIAAWSPPWLFPSYALELEVRIGPEASVEGSGLDGTFSDIAARIALRRAIAQLGRRVTIDASLGAAVHFTRIQGTLTASMQEASERRTNLAGFGRARMTIAIRGRLHAGIHVTAGYTPLRQHYEVGGIRVYSVSHVSLEAGAGVGLVLDW